MKQKAVSLLVSVTLLGMSAAALAQPRGPQPDDHGGPHGQSHGPSGGPSHGPGRGPDRHAGGHRPAPPEASIGRPGGPLPHEDWHKGDRVPADYRDRNYQVDDWRGHGLSAPPRGYHWIGVNGDYVLAAIASGLIANVVISNR